MTYTPKPVTLAPLADITARAIGDTYCEHARNVAYLHATGHLRHGQVLNRLRELDRACLGTPGVWGDVWKAFRAEYVSCTGRPPYDITCDLFNIPR